ncbi:MAG: nitroreductase family protein [Eubacterium sp.]|nr:nitroreductase family protein [Eubacterium sp.]MCM1216678.1 nitroreductase family protein [Lachnospiraceae bacterium]MCM1240398.1 nitroreductase family protein [Lachnospiraceae bacterium]
MLQAITDRRSIRKYKTAHIPREAIEEILKAGTMAPSSKNRQPWKFVVTEGDAREEALAAMERGLEREKVSPFLPESGVHLSDAWHSLSVMRQAPVIIFIVNTLGANLSRPLTADERIAEICNAQSIGAAVENMALAATELGLGSLWICNTFFAYRELCEWLDTDGELYAALAVGYADEEPTARPRKDMRDAVEWRD